MAAPQYRVIEPCFIAPHLLHPGSIIETNGSPGPHLVPLNAEAKSAWDAWLHEEVDEVDDKGKKTGAKIQPHLRYQVFTPNDEAKPEAATVHIVSHPPKDQAGSLDISFAAAQLRQPTADVRPPAAPFSELPETDLLGETKIIAAAPKPKV